MTCIVGLVEDGRVHIGGDSAGVGEGFSLHVRVDPKVFRNGPFVIGFTSSFRMGQLLAYHLAIPPRHPDQDVFAFMVTAFVDSVRQCLKDGGYAERHSEAERAGEFLVGYEGRLFTIHSDYQVSEIAERYAAVGCGAQIALGSLYSTDGKLVPGPLRIKEALCAAERFCAAVRGPHLVISL